MAERRMWQGLLWYDGSERELGEKVMRAAERYEQRTGQWPGLCLVHRSAMGQDEEERVVVDGTGRRVEVVAAGNMLIDHFWLGVEGDEV